MFSSTHTPRFTGERAEVLRPRHRRGSCPCRAGRGGSRASGRQRHAPEVRAVDVRDAVVPRQPLVDERVVGGQQIDDVAVLADDALEEQLRLALERSGAARRPSPDRRRRRARSPAGCADTAAAAPKLVTSAADARIAPASGAPAAPARAAGSGGPASATRDQLVVRDAAPQEERQPRGQLEIGDAIGLARRAPSAGSRSARTRNCGLASSRRSASSMPSSKVAVLAPLLVERHQRRRRPAPSAGRR